LRFPTFHRFHSTLPSAHAMRVPAPPRLGQLAHLLPVNPAAAFGCKNMLASLRRHYHRDPLGSPDAVLPSPTATSSTSSDVDPKFDAETVPDDRTLVGSRRLSSSPSEEEDSMTFGEPPDDEEYVKLQCPSPRGLATYPETRDPSVRRSIIYPLPCLENLLAYEPTTSTPTTMIDSSVAPPLSIPALTPPPTHYKRRRARIISNEDHDPDPDQASIRCVCYHPPRGMTGVDHTTCRFHSEPVDSTLRFPF
jgi:hypothetical protein